jgi:hypothetical protein
MNTCYLIINDYALLSVFTRLCHSVNVITTKVCSKDVHDPNLLVLLKRLLSIAILLKHGTISITMSSKRNTQPPNASTNSQPKLFTQHNSNS